MKNICKRIMWFVIAIMVALMIGYGINLVLELIHIIILSIFAVLA